MIHWDAIAISVVVGLLASRFFRDEDRPVIAGLLSLAINVAVYAWRWPS